MFEKWGWLAAGVLVMAIAGGCKSNPPKENAGAPPAENTGAESGMNAGGTPAEGVTAPTEGTNTGGTPAPTEGATAAPAEQGDHLTLWASWAGDPSARKISVKAGNEEIAQVDAGDNVNEQVVNYLKGKLEAMKGAGKEPKLTIQCPSDMTPFAEYGRPLMRAAFKAGFRATQVDYKAAPKS